PWRRDRGRRKAGRLGPRRAFLHWASAERSGRRLIAGVFLWTEGGGTTCFSASCGTPATAVRSGSLLEFHQPRWGTRCSGNATGAPAVLQSVPAFLLRPPTLPFQTDTLRPREGEGVGEKAPIAFSPKRGSPAMPLGPPARRPRGHVQSGDEKKGWGRLTAVGLYPEAPRCGDIFDHLS